MAANIDNVRVLSLDGGGVRGLASLIILQRIFHVLNVKFETSGRSADFSTPLKPSHFFDLMAGTSTGGLIAIMLGTLGMTVDDCIKNYLELAPKVFPKESLIARTGIGRLAKGAVGAPRFPAVVLETEVKRLVKEYTACGEEAVFDELPASEDRCKV
jgi:patatin-like phospholipase/acyl hydrolase